MALRFFTELPFSKIASSVNSHQAPLKYNLIKKKAENA